MVQWLRLHAPNAGDMGSILGQGTEITYAAIKSLHIAAKGPNDSAKIPCAGIAKEIKKIFKNRREAPSCFFFYYRGIDYATFFFFETLYSRKLLQI